MTSLLLLFEDDVVDDPFARFLVADQLELHLAMGLFRGDFDLLFLIRNVLDLDDRELFLGVLIHDLQRIDRIFAPQRLLVERSEALAFS